MTRLKDATFEGASLTGTNGFTSTTGSPTLDSTSKVRGTYSARTNWASATNMNGTISGLNEPEIWFSFYIYVAALPTTGAPRVVTVSNGSTQFNITLNSSGVLTARLNTSNQAPSIGTVSLNTAYRVGVHLKVSTAAGNSDGVMDVYFATGDAAFGSPILTTSSVLMNTTNANFSSITFGMNNGVATTGDVYWDSIRIDNVSMPSSDGSTDTPKTVNVTVSNTLVTTKAVGKPITKAITSTVSIVRTIALIKALIITLAASVIKAKPIVVALSVLNSATIQKTVGKPISVAVTSTIAKAAAYSKIISNTVTSTISAGKAFPIVITKAITSTPTVTKNILKDITRSITSTPIVTKGLVTLKTISYAVTSTINFTKGIVTLKTVTYAVTSTVSFAKGIVNLKTITLAVTSTKSVLKNVGKPVTKTVTSTLTRITNIPHNVLVSVTPILFMNRGIAKNISRVITETVSSVVGKGYFRNPTVVVNVSSVIQKNILKPIAVMQSTIVSLGPKNIGKTLSTIITSVVSSIHGNLILKDITVIVSTAVSRMIGISKTINVVQGTIVNVQRSFTLLIERAINIPVVLDVQKRILLTRAVIVDTAITFSKLLANQFTNTYFRKNVRNLTIGIKNSALSVLGRNTRTINLRDTNHDDN